MTKHSYIFVSLFIAILLLILMLGCSIMINANKKANAEYVDILYDTAALVNFNQQYNFNSYNTSGSTGGLNYTRNENQFFINGTNSSTTWIGTFNFNAVIGHTYYFYVKVSTPDIQLLLENNNINIFLSTTPIIYTNNTYTAFTTYLRLNARSYSNATAQFYCIDLSLMFGNDNLPNIQQCQDLFVADYYPYNTGTPVSLNGLNAYVDGVNSVLSGQSIYYSREYVANNMQAIRFNDITGDYALDINSAYPTQPRYRYTINDHVQITFASVITAGQNFKFSFWLCRAEYNDVTPLEIGYFIQSNFYPITTINATAQFDNLQYYELELTAPVDMNVIVLNIPHNYELTDPDYQWYSVYMADIELTYILQDATALLHNAQDYGYNQAKQQYEAMLDTYRGSNGSGNSGYMSIYNEGLQAGANAQLEDLGIHFYTFSEFLGALFDVPVHTLISLLDFDLFGFNMKNLVFSLITLSIVFAIIKLILVKTGDK